MTSIYEGTPMCALEAQALGKPIVATPVDGLKEIVINGCNGYLFDNNELLASKILFLLKTEKYKEFELNSIEKFDLNFNLENYIKNIDKIYTERM